MTLRKLSILGPGLLGGSIGLAARHRKIARRVVMWARRPDAADQAYQLGAADEATNDLAKVVADAELVVLATPIGAMRALVEQIVPPLPAGCVVTDVGSVKYPIVAGIVGCACGQSAVCGLPSDGRFGTIGHRRGAARSVRKRRLHRHAARGHRQGRAARWYTISGRHWVVR